MLASPRPQLCQLSPRRVSMHLPGSDAALGVRTPSPLWALLLGGLLCRGRQVEVIQDPGVYLLFLQRAAGQRHHGAVTPPTSRGCPPPRPTVARRCTRTYLSRRRTVDMSVCSRVQVSSHWMSSSTMMRHTSRSKRSLVSTRCTTMLRPAGTRRGRGGCHFVPAQTHLPAPPSCCPLTRSFLFLFLLVFSLFGCLQLLLPSSDVPCKGQGPPGKG